MQKVVGSEIQRSKSMNTSGFVFVCLLLAVFLPAGSEAQQDKVYRVGLLSGPGKTEERPQTKGFRAGLREAGYIAGC